MDPDNIRPWYRKHPERVVPPQVLLDQERELLEVAQLSAVLGPHASLIEGHAVMRHVVIRVVKRPDESLCLERGQFVPIGRLYRMKSLVHASHRTDDLLDFGVQMRNMLPWFQVVSATG